MAVNKREAEPEPAQGSLLAWSAGQRLLLVVLVLTLLWAAVLWALTAGAPDRAAALDRPSGSSALT